MQSQRVANFILPMWMWKLLNFWLEGERCELRAILVEEGKKKIPWNLIENNTDVISK